MKTMAKKILKTIYGYDNFREGQNLIIDNILSKNDVLGIMSTGAGKSICYQIPALIYSGLTIVVSPLISLMKDQVDTLKHLGVKADFLNSTLSKDEYIKLIKNIKYSNLKLLYVSPERLLNPSFIEIIKKVKISMLAIDEAHCISQWGHDFRKSYLEIPKFLELINQRPQILALTATATKKVREDIIEKLNLHNPKISIDSFDRENISLKVVKNIVPEAYIINYLKTSKKKSGIIYTSTRKEVDNLYSYLDLKGYEVGKYHGGLDENERKHFQEKFLNDEIKIMVATNAFGMGINKSNVRYVIHRNIPKDIESYYQEIGRAGRDGAKAEAILMFFEEDVSTQEYLIEQNKDSDENLKKSKLEKLDKMVEYAYLESCYREYILKYFRDKRIKNFCGNCGNCKQLKDIKMLSEDAQKIFSCIGRTREQIGISTLINILKGKIDDKIEKKEYKNLSTFGIMSNYKIIELEEFVYYLISEKYLEQSAGSYPVLKLTGKAYEVLKGKKSVHRKNNETVTFDFYDDPTFNVLNSLRKEISKKEGVAPYIIFSDLTLLEIAEKKPSNRWEMLKIRGVGNQKFKNYGEIFIEKILELFPEKNIYQKNKNLNSENIISFDTENEIFIKKYIETSRLEELKNSLKLEIENNELKKILLQSIFKK